jgi:hypothetical protein
LNAVEIEQAITDLAEQPFDAANFPYAFLEAFGNKETTIKRLRAGASNKSDVGGVLQTNNIHISTCKVGEVAQTLKTLKVSPATSKAKARFVLATDGVDFEAEDLTGDSDPVACAYKDFPDHFGFFLPLAGITTVRQISENAFDIRATSRLNRLYVELLKDNPEWGGAERRHDMNHFMARLIFCFFAEDTDIFIGKRLFTNTVAEMSAKDSSNTHEVIGTLFRAMNTKPGADRAAIHLPRWADSFPYVNGGLFSGSLDAPRFSKIARSYLLHVGGLDWTKINPDIFGSMIQAVAEDEERGKLGMHYTSVPNILKVLNPLFLDDLRVRLEEAGNNARTLLNLRKRISKIRVLDPACGSGNFLVIAYKQMRAIEAEINTRRGEPDRSSDIPLTNFRGIELRDFPCEIARLALVIAEYQCDVLYRGQKLALAEFLPLRNENWITCGNALQIDWLSIWPAASTGVKLIGDDLFQSPLDQAEIDFENEGGETYICGNPPYKGSQDQTEQQKADLVHVFAKDNVSSGVADYVLGWFAKAAAFIRKHPATFAFVTTNSVHQGRQVARIWPALLGKDLRIVFAEPSFKWSNLASNKAVVTVSIIGISSAPDKCRIISDGLAREVEQIGPYLVPGPTVFVDERRTALSDVSPMSFGSMPNDGGALLLKYDEFKELIADDRARPFLRSAAGTREFINGLPRYCVWVNDDDYEKAKAVPSLASRFNRVKTARAQSKRAATNSLSQWPYRFGEVRQTGDESVIIVSKTASDNRDYIPASLLQRGGIVTEAFGLFDAPLWNLAIVVSRLHTVWAKTVCGRMKSDPRYSNTLGWNTFPIPPMTEKNRSDLTRCAEAILVAREHHFPATIADLYDPEAMPSDLRAAHERNDEVLERIYVGRRFKNDTERLEKLFELYTKMTDVAAPVQVKPKKRNAGARA